MYFTCTFEFDFIGLTLKLSLRPFQSFPSLKRGSAQLCSGTQPRRKMPRELELAGVFHEGLLLPERCYSTQKDSGDSVRWRFTLGIQQVPKISKTEGGDLGSELPVV